MDLDGEIKTLSNSLFWSEWIDKRHEYHKYYKLIDNFLVGRKILLNDWMRGRYSAEEICNILGKEIKSMVNNFEIFRKQREGQKKPRLSEESISFAAKIDVIDYYLKNKKSSVRNACLKIFDEYYKQEPDFQNLDFQSSSER